MNEAALIFCRIRGKSNILALFSSCKYAIALKLHWRHLLLTNSGQARLPTIDAPETLNTSIVVLCCACASVSLLLTHLFLCVRVTIRVL